MDLVLRLDLGLTTTTTSFFTFADSIGLVRSNPVFVFGLKVVLMIFSLVGVPPLLGVFFPKLNIFISLVDASFYLVAVFAVLTSVISAFYYIRLI